MFARSELAGRVLGFLTVPGSLALLGALAGTAGHGHVPAVLELLAGAAFMGAVLDGLLLGHWYLTDRRLTRTPINRTTTLLLAAVVLEAAAVIGRGIVRGRRDGRHDRAHRGVHPAGARGNQGHGRPGRDGLLLPGGHHRVHRRARRQDPVPAVSGDAVVWTLLGAGAVAQVVAWRLVVAGRISVWFGTGVLVGLLGALSVATGRVHLSPKVDVVP